MKIFPKLRPLILVGLFISFLLGSILLPGNLIQAATPTKNSSETSLTQGVKKTVLDNGLVVLTKEVHTAPVVSVQVWYKVGSRNEGAKENGISHQLEHLLFKGTKTRPVQFGRLFSALGSQFNAFTSYDMTAYFGTVQRDKVDALIILEADRMQNALIGAEELKSEKRVVISELQGSENSPNYRLSRAVMRAAFPNHQYGLPVGGTKSDVENFTLEQVRNYYQTYYSPDNTVLVVTGDFDTAATLKTVKATFGKVPKRPQVVKSQEVEKVATAPQKNPIILKEPGSTPLLQIVYPLTNIKHPDVPAIDVMDAILTGGRSSRLYQTLVETGLASSVGATASELIEPGWYEFNVSGAPGKDLQQVAEVLQKTVAQMQQKPVTAAELNRAKTLLKASFILGNQDITSQATQLGYNQTTTGDYLFLDRYLAGVAKVTPEDIQRVTKTYLNPAKQTIGFFEPTQPDGKPGDSGGGSGKTVENFNPGKPVDPAELAKYLPKSVASNIPSKQSLPEEVTLKNGLKVFLLRDRSTPTINISGQISAGTGFDTSAKAGVANLVAGNLMNGTKTKNALTLAQSLEDKGASVAFSASREGVSVGAQGLSTNLPLLVQTMADVMQNATFPAEQLELTRQRALTGLKAQLDDPRSYGRRVFQQAIYPANHPFHTFPTEASLKAITREDLVSFYKQYYRPDTTNLAIVGDFDPNQIKTLLNQAFGKWQLQGKATVLKVPKVALPTKIATLNPVIPGKAEAITYIGYNGISRKDPRYYAVLIMNQILGGDTLSSRLGTEVRDRQGLTYGIYSAFSAGNNPGPFLIQMQTAPGDAPKAIASTLGLLKQLRDQGITEAEFNNAKRSITSSYPVDLASPSEVASIISGNYSNGLTATEIRDFPSRINGVTMAQVQKVIQELIQPDKLVIVTVGPGEGTPKGN